MPKSTGFTRFAKRADFQNLTAARFLTLRPREGNVPDKLIALREHFRCVEPIIRSRCLSTRTLVPCACRPRRSASTRRLSISTSGGPAHGDKNPREAEIMVEEIRKSSDPSLARVEAQDRWRTIGVISLIGGKQAALIDRMLLDELGESSGRHRIARGDSATFQGDERDVVFLSMVLTQSASQSQTARHFGQRFDVASSRARDRLVLVRSVRRRSLSPKT